MAETHATIPSVPSTNVRPSLKYTAKATPLPSSLLSEAGAMWLKAQAVNADHEHSKTTGCSSAVLIQFFGDIALSDFISGTSSITRKAASRTLLRTASIMS